MKIIYLIISTLIALKSYSQSEYEITQAVDINSSIYIKPIKNKSAGIEEYLQYFKLMGSFKYEGKQSGNPNWNPADGEDPYSWYSKSIEMYDKGIILWGFKEYEGESFELYIPIITTEQAKKLLERLCKNMGGCLTPEEVNVTYELFQDGVLISWGGGC